MRTQFKKATHNTAVQNLMQKGIGLNDPRGELMKKVLLSLLTLAWLQAGLSHSIAEELSHRRNPPQLASTPGLLR
jgi:hypothetical protein